MRKHYLLYGILLLVCCQANFSFAQGINVTGTVRDETGTSLPGVNIVVKGTSVGTISDAQGKFSLNAPDANTTLVFSFIGYVSQEVQVGDNTSIEISMKSDVKALDEVVVTALGVQKESKRLGYAATTVQTEELVKQRTTNVMESLEGKVAGLNISPPAAGAGSSMQIRLRGQSAFAGANNAPLIVLNGLPMDQGARGANGNGDVNQRDRGDNLQNINPDDIETMTVLKGATAAALYGSRAANGAIIITTKSGSKNQDLGVDFTSSYTASNALNYLGEIEQTQYGQGVDGARFTTVGQIGSFGQFGWGEKLDGQPVMNFDGKMRPYSAEPGQLFKYLQTAKNFTNTIGLSGGGAKGSFRLSFSNVDATGIVPTNTYKKKIFNVAINHNITDKLKFQMNFNYTVEDNYNPPAIGTQGEGVVNFFNRMPNSVPFSAYSESPLDPVLGGELKTSSFLGTVNNPYVPRVKNQFFKDDRSRFLGTATLRYQVTDWLYAQGRFNYDRGTDFMEWNTVSAAGSASLISSDGLTYRGAYNIQQQDTYDINADFLLGGNKTFGKFSVDASFGGNTWRTQFQQQAQGATNFTVLDLYSIANGTVKTQSYGFNKTRVNSLYGWTEFGYNGMFYLNLTGRNDWFSVLNPSKNSVFYPSASGSFIFSEVIPKQSWLSYGKLRASYAIVGSANGVNPYDNVLTYAINNNQFNLQTLATLNGTSSPNPNLQPFKVTEKEIGLEMRFLNNRLNLDVAYFDKVTTDQILDVTVSTASGFNTTKQNRASLKNSGMETLIEFKAIQTSDFTWTTSWNNAFLKTEVLDTGTPTGTILVNAFNANGNEFLGELRYTTGLPMNQLYIRHLPKNANGDVIVQANGRLVNQPTGGPLNTGFYPIGSSIPNYTGGWNNTFTYKNLSVGVLIDYKLGGMVMSSTLLNMTRQGLSTMSLEGRETGILIPGVYQSDGTPNTSVITPANLRLHWADYRNYQIGDPFVYKSDFIKLRNITIAYNFTSMVKNVSSLKFVKGLTLSANCRNVAILYKDLPGLDPEQVQSSGDFRAGYENSSLPTQRSYNVTLNVKF